MRGGGGWYLNTCERHCYLIELNYNFCSYLDKTTRKFFCISCPKICILPKTMPKVEHFQRVQIIFLSALFSVPKILILHAEKYCSYQVRRFQIGILVTLTPYTLHSTRIDYFPHLIGNILFFDWYALRHCVWSRFCLKFKKLKIKLLRSYRRISVIPVFRIDCC